MRSFVVFSHFFGFKPVTALPGRPVDDLFQSIEKIMSTTYLNLCKIANRPNIMDIASRAVRVIWDQTTDLRPEGRASVPSRLPAFFRKMDKFLKARTDALKVQNAKSSKISPTTKATDGLIDQFPSLAYNTLHASYTGILNCKKQRLFVKLVTDRFSYRQLDKRGFDAPTSCRRGCLTADSLDHFIGTHIYPSLPASFPKGLKRQFRKAMRHETFSSADPCVIATASVLSDPSDNMTPQKKRRRVASTL